MTELAELNAVLIGSAKDALRASEPNFRADWDTAEVVEGRGDADWLHSITVQFHGYWSANWQVDQQDANAWAVTEPREYWVTLSAAGISTMRIDF
jgi:hypothetical protein